MKRQPLLTKTLRFAMVAAITSGLLCVTFALIGMMQTGGPSPPVAHAQGTINVTTYDDEYDTDPGECSLREAIAAINEDADFGGCANPGGTADTVQLIAGTYPLTIAGPGDYDSSKGSLYLYDDITILGDGPESTVISGANSLNDRIFFQYGGGSPQTIAIEGLTIQGGNASSGSGGGLDIVIADPDSQLRLTNVVVRDNQALYYGGGLHLPYGPQVILDRVTIYNNQGSDGGGLYFGDQYGPGSGEPGNDRLVMTNVTIYSNTSTTRGGGLYAGYANEGSGITATNVTIAGNVAATSGGNVYNNNSILSLKNTIIADGIAGGTDNDCAGNPNAGITSLGHNLDGDGSCGLDATGDITDTDPLLDSALRYNGGIMSTVALLDNSPAINQGSGCPGADQRGFPRLGPCDIGAFEYAASELHLPLVLKRE